MGKHELNRRALLSASIPAALLTILPAVSHAAPLSNGTWTQASSGGLWDDASVGNWDGGIVADGAGFTANFNTLDITADNTVHLNQPRTIGNLIFGDTTTSSVAGWILTNNSNVSNILTLAGATPTITVNALGGTKAVFVSAQMAGTDGLTKAGAGTLVLQANNTWSGGTNVNAGTLVVGTNTSQAGIATGLLGSGAVTLGTNTNLVFGRSGTYNLNASTILQVPSTSNGRVQIGGSATYSLGSSTANTFAGFLQLIHGSTLEYTDETLPAARVGAGPFTVPVGALGTNATITVANAPTFKVLTNGANDATVQTLNVARSFQLASGGQTLTIVADRGSGTGTNKVVAFTGGTTLNAAVPTGGTTTANFQGGNGYRIALANATAISIGGGNTTGTLRLNPTTANVSVLGNVVNSTTNATAAVKTLQLDGTSGDNLITGSISDGSAGSNVTTALLKSNGSAWTLSGSSSYSGGTTVSGGKLLVTNTTGSATGSGAVNVTAGTLGGTGIISGNVAIAGTVSPGLSIGTLTTGGLSITAGTFEAELDTQSLTADKIVVNGDLAISGASVLSLSDLAAVPQVVPADTTVFTLIEYTGTWNGGTFGGLADDSEFDFGSNRYAINYNDAGRVTLTAVPEPAMLGVIALAGAALAMRRRASK